MFKNIRLINSLPFSNSSINELQICIAAVIFRQVLRETTQYSVLIPLKIYFNSISSFFNSIAFVIIYIQQVQRESAGYTPHRHKTNFSSLSHGRFWMCRWRLDTSHEDWRQQGITLNQLSTRIRKELLSAKLKWPLRGNEINSLFLRWLIIKSNSSLVEILDTKFDFSRSSLVLRIRFDHKIVYVNN